MGTQRLLGDGVIVDDYISFLDAKGKSKVALITKSDLQSSTVIGIDAMVPLRVANLSPWTIDRGWITRSYGQQRPSPLACRELREGLYYDSFLSPLGIVYIYRLLSLAERQQIEDMCHEAHHLLTIQGLTYLLPFTIEIRPKSGTTEGRFKQQRRKQKTGTIILYPSGNTFTLMHEIGHAVWIDFAFNGIIDWARMHKQATEREWITRSTIDRMLRRWKESGKTREGFRKSLSEHGQRRFKACVDWVKTFNHMDSATCVRILDELQVQNRWQMVERMWPDGEISSIVRVRVLATSYGCKNPEELYAEAFAMYMLGVPFPSSGVVAPDKVRDLVRDTLPRPTKQQIAQHKRNKK